MSRPYTFQSTPPRRRRRNVSARISVSFAFQSTPPRRRRLISSARISSYILYFNPRLREGGDDVGYGDMFFRWLFQSTPPRRRRPQHIVIPQLSCTYLASTTFLSAIFSFISQYVVLFFLF